MILAGIFNLYRGNRPQDPDTARVLPKNKLVNGEGVLSDINTANDGALQIDVSMLQSQLKPLVEERKRPTLSTEDQNKNVRFIVLFVFFFTNLLGAAAITYGAAASQNAVVLGVQGSFNVFVEFYMLVLFCSICFFASVRFIGCIWFLLKTPVYK